jgi:hypothetical protein
MSLHPITINQEERYLLLGKPDWSKGISITHNLNSEIEEGLTGVEARTVLHEAFRLEMQFSLIIEDEDAASFRDKLKTLKSKRVAVPLWPDLLPSGSSRIYASNYMLGWDFESDDFAINADANHPYKAPLLFGYFKDDPEIEVIGMQQIRMNLKVEEDSPFAQRIRIQAADISQNWPQSLWPDWSSNQSSLQSHVERKQVGQVRVKHVDGSESMSRLTQQAQFILEGPGDVRKLLGFYLSKHGRRDPFFLPYFIQGEKQIIRHGAFRFAKNGIKITYEAPGHATATISFIEAPSIEEHQQSLPSKAYLYEFIYQVPTPISYYYTSYEKNLIYAGKLFESQKIEHSNRKQSTNPAKDEITITCGEFRDSLGRRNPLWKRVGFGLERRLQLTIYECDPSDPETTATVFWNGSCGEVTPEGRLFKAKSVPFVGRLSSMVPATVMKTTCNNFFCDKLCDPSGTLRNAMEHQAVVSSTDESQVTLQGVTAPSGFFAGGWIEIGDGDRHEFRAILNNSYSGGTQVISVQRPLRYDHANEAATLLPDCDGMPSRCKAYGNFSNFRGFPLIPQDNPSLPEVTVNTDYGKK